MAQILEQATLVDMPAVESKRKLPKLPKGSYYIERALTPIERLKRNGEYAKALRVFAYSVSRKALYYKDQFEASAYVDQSGRKDIESSFYNISQLLNKLVDVFQSDHDIDAGIAVPLPDGLTFEQVEIEGEEE